MKYFVVDENVPMVANDAVRHSAGKPLMTPHANESCRHSCFNKIKDIIRNGIVFIDDAGVILSKYRAHLDGKGQPGVGDMFLRHIMDRQYDRRKVRRVNLAVDQSGEYIIFPRLAALRNFDPSDRIFICVSLGCPERPAIVNAVDSDYSEFSEAIRSIDVNVEELCGDCLRSKSRQTS